LFSCVGFVASAIKEATYDIIVNGLRNGEDRIRTTAKNPVIPALLNDRAAKSAALTVTDAELLHVVRSWASLPNPIKLAILALVQSRFA
jgi:hypothetical protein